jgi:hypothetical protein
VRGLLGRRPVCPALRSGLMKVACASSRISKEFGSTTLKTRAPELNGFVDLPGVDGLNQWLSTRVLPSLLFQLVNHRVDDSDKGVM